MGKKLSDDFVDNRLIVYGMDSEEENQEVKNNIVDEFNKSIQAIEFNKKLEEEEDGD